MPSRFQTMKCAASELLTTSTAWMLLAYSWPMRWKMRSPPERSTRMAIPGYFASKALAIRSATGRSTAVYQMTLPSFRAASISSGVTLLATGAAANAVRSNWGRAIELAASPRTTRRRVTLPANMAQFLHFPASSTHQRTTPFRLQNEPHGRAGGEVALRRGGDAQLCAVRCFDDIV